MSEKRKIQNRKHTGGKLRNLEDGIRDVGTRDDGAVHEGPNGFSVGDLLHLLLVYKRCTGINSCNDVPIFDCSISGTRVTTPVISEAETS